MVAIQTELRVLLPWMLVIILLSLVGNLVTLIILVKSRELRSNNLYIVNLTVANVVSAVLVQGGLLIAVRLQTPHQRQLLCNINMSIFYIASFVTVVTLTAIALDKYCAVMKPFNYRQHNRKRQVRVVITLSWVLGLVFFIPRLIAMIHNKRDVRFCSNQSKHDVSMSEVASEITTLTLVFLLPNVVICCAYTRLIHKLWCTAVAAQGTNIALLRSRRKLTKLSITMTTVFVICWTPYSVGAILWCLEVPTEKWMDILALFSVLVYCAVSSLLYAFFNTAFQNAAKNFCKSCCCYFEGGQGGRRRVIPGNQAAEMSLNVITAHAPASKEAEDSLASRETIRIE